MKKRHSNRPKIGDVIEIPTRNGFAYAQYTHRNQLCGFLIRILPGVFPSRPSNFADLIEQTEADIAFVFLLDDLRNNLASIVAHQDVPERFRPFPMFRAGIVNPASGRVECWWLWDGEREWKVGELTPELFRLPIREVWSNTLLRERIAKKYDKPD